MARGINKVILIGNLGNDPELKYASTGNAMANLTIATSEQWTDRNNNEKKEKTEWHRVVFYGKLAEIVSQYAAKGSQIYVEGKLQTRKWTDQSGQDRYTTEVVVDSFQGVLQLLGGNKQNQSTNYQQNVQPRATNSNVQQNTPVSNVQQNVTGTNNMNNPDNNFNDDDIPF